MSATNISTSVLTLSTHLRVVSITAKIGYCGNLYIMWQFYPKLRLTFDPKGYSAFGCCATSITVNHLPFTNSVTVSDFCCKIMHYWISHVLSFHSFPSPAGVTAASSQRYLATLAGFCAWPSPPTTSTSSRGPRTARSKSGRWRPSNASTHSPSTPTRFSLPL